MATALLSDRPTYQRSGKVLWGRLAVATPIVFAVAAAMALLLSLLFRWGWYYSLIIPAVLALPVAAAGYAAVRFAHCRNVAVAGVIGFVSAMIYFPGYYYPDMVSSLGPQAVLRIDLLPKYIWFRMQNDVEVDNGREREPNVVTNLAFFTVDQLLVLAIVIGVSASRAYGVYCERCQCWSRTALIITPLGTASRVADALAAGRLHELPMLPSIGATTRNSCTIKLQCCPNVAAGEPCQIYLTLQDNVGQKSKTGETHLVVGEITADELRELGARVKAFKPLVPAGGSVAVPELVESSDLIASDLPTAAATQFVTLETLPPEQAGSVYSKQNLALAICLSLFPIGVLLAGVGLLVWGVMLKPWNAEAATVAMAAALFAVGLIGIAFGLVVCKTNVDYFNMSYGLKLTRREIESRAEALVSPNDNRAVYVELVPRKKWTGLLADSADDGGFLMVDDRQGRILFEGTKQRITIPAAGVSRCEVECTTPDAGASLSFYATVIQAHAVSPTDGAAQAWEACFMVRPTAFERYNAAYRQRSCEELRDQIRGVMSSV